ncbi:MAG: hypothetical protein HFI01_02190 [Lachnospiraceae bacterium]|nr:hypothetical protein [Lachnospiraceae bacterium]
MAYHVLDIICQMMKSSEKGAFERVGSTCGRPGAFRQSGLNCFRNA